MPASTPDNAPRTTTAGTTRGTLTGRSGDGRGTPCGDTASRGGLHGQDDDGQQSDVDDGGTTGGTLTRATASSEQRIRRYERTAGAPSLAGDRTASLRSKRSRPPRIDLHPKIPIFRTTQWAIYKQGRIRLADLQQLIDTAKRGTKPRAETVFLNLCRSSRFPSVGGVDVGKRAKGIYLLATRQRSSSPRLAVLLFASTSVWPTTYRYDYVKSGQNTYLVRTHWIFPSHGPGFFRVKLGRKGLPCGCNGALWSGSRWSASGRIAAECRVMPA